MPDQEAKGSAWVTNLIASFIGALLIGLGTLWERGWEYWGWGWRKGLGWDPRAVAVVTGLVAFGAGFLYLQFGRRRK